MGKIFLGLLVTIFLMVASSDGNGQDPPIHVDLYGDQLPVGAIARAGSERLRSGRSVENVFFSRDGKEMASWSNRWEGELVFCRWEVATGKLITKHTFPQTKLMVCHYFDSNRALAMLRSKDHKYYPWDFLADQDPPYIDGDVSPLSWRRDDEWFGQFAISSDGETLAATTTGHLIFGLKKRTVKLWRFEHGKSLEEMVLLHELPREMNDLFSIKFTDDGSRLVAISLNEDPAGNRNQVPAESFVWDVESGTLFNRFEIGDINLFGNFKSIAISLPGNQFAISVPDNLVAIFDLEAGTLESTVPCSERWHCLDYFGNDLILGNSWDGMIRRVDPLTGDTKSELGNHPVVESIAISPDGSILVSGGQDKMIRLWDIESKEQIHSFDGHENSVWSLEVASDDSWFVTAGWDGKICYWDTTTGKLLRERSIQGNINSLALSQDDRFLAVGGYFDNDVTVQIFDEHSEEGIRSIKNRGAIGLNSLTFAKNGSWLIAGEADEAILRIWDVESGNEVHQLYFTPPFAKTSDRPRISCVTTSDDGNFMLVCSSRGFVANYVCVLAIENLETICEFEPKKGSVKSACFFPNGTEIVMGGYSRLGGGESHSVELRDSVQIRLTETGEILSRFPGVASSYDRPPRRVVNDVAVSPDGRLIATAEKGGTIEIYDAIREISLTTLRHSEDCHAVQFTHDGGKLISVGSDHCALVWEIEAADWRR